MENFNEPLISVIVPVYNERRYLKECVESIEKQTYNNIEIILVDDGSTDGTSQDCDELAEKDNRIKVIHKKNEGLSSARITGLENSVGDWVMFVDDDDVIAHNMLESFTRYVNNEKLDIIIGDRMDTDDASLVYTENSLGDGIFLEGIEACNKIVANEIITPLWGKIYRKDFLNKMDLEKHKILCPTIFFEDVLMTPILYYSAREVCVIDKPFYLHREVPTSISRSGKMGSFYYEQIYSGNILLEFMELHKVKKFYVWYLREYMKTLIRDWCLMGKGLPVNEIQTLKSDILKYYKKYRKQYKEDVHTNWVEKSAFCMFGYMPHLVGRVIRVIYFKKRSIN